MSDVTRLFQAIERGDPKASEALFPVVYEELRRLARAQMATERAEHTLQATALVHEAYLRLVADEAGSWDGRGHFFATAVEAMRRILIEHARSKNAIKRGGRIGREELNGAIVEDDSPSVRLDDLLALDEALTKLAAESPQKAQLVKLRYFAGLSLAEAASAMDISERTAKRYWVTAKGWLFQQLNP
jgi:RNA polymerase sigma factor (TIGR02999 family)